MTKNEKVAFAKLVRHMQDLQRQIAKPTHKDATDKEVVALLGMFWEWTPFPRYNLPSKTTIENLIGLMRGLTDGGYCYISRGDVARVIRNESKKNYKERSMLVILNTSSDKMTDTELYDNGKWNYKETPIVKMLWDIHHKQSEFRNL